jgi:hypothetical protein
MDLSAGGRRPDPFTGDCAAIQRMRPIGSLRRGCPMRLPEQIAGRHYRSGVIPLAGFRRTWR